MTARRRRVQTSFTDLFAFGGIPRPEELMDPVLKKLDAVLDDEQLVDRVFEALSTRREASARTGRPSTPAEVVLRTLVLKHLRGWSYDQLQWEMSGNFVYRRFCRIDGGDVPDAKTMVRYGQLLGGDLLQQLFDRVIEIAKIRGVTKAVGFASIRRSWRRRFTIRRTAVFLPMRFACCRAKWARLRRQERSSLSSGPTCAEASHVGCWRSGTHYGSAATPQRQRW